MDGLHEEIQVQTDRRDRLKSYNDSPNQETINLQISLNTQIPNNHLIKVGSEIEGKIDGRKIAEKKQAGKESATEGVPPNSGLESEPT